MKRPQLLSLLAAGCFLFGCGSDAPEVSTADWSTTVGAHGATVKLPKSWKFWNPGDKSQVTALRDYLKDKSKLMGIMSQLSNIDHLELVACEPQNLYGMNITYNIGGFAIPVEQLRDKLVESNRNSASWIGMPEAGIVPIGAKQGVIIEGLMPQGFGENVEVIEYAVPDGDTLFTATFMCAASKKDQLKPIAKSIVDTLSFKK